MRFTLDKEKILELYDYYRYALLPIGIIAFCILITLFLLVPQLLSSLGNKSSYDLEKNKLQVLNDNLSYVSVLDSAGLEKDLDTASLALPPQTNFDSVIGSIYYAAASSGAGVGDFQFNLDDAPQPGSISSLTVDLKIIAQPEATMAFIKELYKIYPLSSTESIRVGDKTKEITLLFYYKPFLTKIEDNSTPIPKITSADEAILQKISSWKKPESALAPAASSTTSGGLSPDFPF